MGKFRSVNKRISRRNLYNVVRRCKERSGSIFNSPKASDCNHLFTENDLSEVKHGGRHFTWVSNDGMKQSKLDRFLVNKRFLEEWPDVEAVVKDRVFANHCPVIMKDGSKDFGPTPFRFFDHPLWENGFGEMIKAAWDQGSPKGPPDVVFKDKLKILKGRIKEWQKTEFQQGRRQGGGG